MISLQEYKLDDRGKELCRILEDELLMDKLYSKMYPELHSEILKQYGSAKNHFYQLSEKAHKQYLEYRYGLVDMV